MIENLNSKVLIIIALVLLLIYINIEFKQNNIENMSGSVRKIEDYCTAKTDERQKILELNYTIDNKKYKLGFINKEKFNPNCKLCDKTDLNNIYPVLTNSSLISKKSCEKDELIKCYNENVIADCKTNALTICYNNKISSTFSELMIYNIEEKKVDEKGNVLEPSYILRTGDDKTTVLLLEPSEVEIKNLVTNVMEKHISYFVCCGKAPSTIPENKKHLYQFYLEQDTEKMDKIRFKIYFILKTQETGVAKKIYLGYSKENLCDNIICNNNEKCKDDFRSLTLYTDPKNTNVISFEPELVRFD